MFHVTLDRILLKRDFEFSQKPNLCLALRFVPRYGDGNYYTGMLCDGCDRVPSMVAVDQLAMLMGDGSVTVMRMGCAVEPSRVVFGQLMTVH